MKTIHKIQAPGGGYFLINCYSLDILGPFESNAQEVIPDSFGMLPFEIMPFEELQPLAMRLEVSERCNLHCEYCLVYKNGLGTSGRQMSAEVADSILQTFHKEISHGPVTITGGEPLMNWAILKRLITALSSRASIDLLTNGLLLSDERICFLAKHRVNTRISLDGFEEHNRSRFSPDPSTTFQKLVKTIKKGLRSGLKVAINCTVTVNNINSLTKIHNFFVRDLGVKEIGYNLPHYAKDSAYNDVDVTLYAQKLLEIYELSKVEGIYVSQIMSRLIPLVNRRFKAFACPVLGPQVTFLPDGTKTMCTKLMSSEKTAAITGRELYEGLPFFTSKCRSCPAIGICGGGCYWDGLIRNGEPRDDRVCILHEILLPHLVANVASWRRRFGQNIHKELNSIFGTSVFKDNY